MTDSSDKLSVLQTLHSLIKVLPASHPPYCLIGALALGAWGQVRATQDIDFLTLFEGDLMVSLQNRLEPLGFTLDGEWADANPHLRGQMVRFRHVAYPLDLLSARDAHDREVLQRRSEISLGEFSVWVCSPEDLILLKLKVGRPRDFEDALSVIQLQEGNLDMDYMWRWTDRLGLQGELQYVLNAASPQ